VPGGTRGDPAPNVRDPPWRRHRQSRLRRRRRTRLACCAWRSRRSTAAGARSTSAACDQPTPPPVRRILFLLIFFPKQTTPPRRHNHRQTPSFSLDPTGRRRARRSPSPNPAAGSMAPRPSLREAGRARATADGGLRQQQLLRRRGQFCVPWPQIRWFPAVRSHSISSKLRGCSSICSDFSLWISMLQRHAQERSPVLTSLVG